MCSKMSRLLIGSTSKYCLEHASCNVLVMKSPIAQAELHADKKTVIQEEENERARRIAEEEAIEHNILRTSAEHRQLAAQAEGELLFIS